MSSPEKKMSFSFLKKRWVKIWGGLVLMTALLFLLLPIGTKYYLIDWLEKSGADSATIGKLRYNPFLGKITLAGLEVEKGGVSRLHNSSMILDIGITSLFNHDIRLEKVEYRDLSIDLEQYDDGRWRFASFTTSAESGGPATQPDENRASAWAFLADRVVLENCRAHLKTPDLEMTLLVSQAELIKFTTREGQPAGKLTFTGQLDGSPVSLQLESVQVTPELRIAGNISVSTFKLGELSQLLSEILPTLGGDIGLDGNILFSKGREKGIQVDYDGTIDIARPDMGNSDFDLKADSYKWEGKVQYLGPENAPATLETDGLLTARDVTLEAPEAGLASRESRIDFAGKTKVILADTITVENDGSLLVEGVELALPPYSIAEESLLWKGKILYDSDHNKEGLAVFTKGSLDLGVFQLESGEQAASFAFGSEMLSWRGDCVFSQPVSGGRSVIEVDGSLTGVELFANLKEQQLQFGQGRVSLNTSSTISLGQEMDIFGNSSATFEQFRLLEGENESPVMIFEKMAVAELQGRGAKTVAAKDILTTGLQVSIAGNFPLAIDTPEILLSDLFTEDLATFSAAGLSLKKTLVTALHNKGELVSFDGLMVKNIVVDNEAKVMAGNVHLENLFFMKHQGDPANKTALSLGSATLTDINWSGETGLQGDSLQFVDLVATIVRDKDGDINVSKELKAMQLSAPEAGVESELSPENAEASPGAPIKLKKITVGGGSAFSFEDYTLAIPFTTDLEISRFEVTDIDSSQPNNGLGVFLEGEFDKRAPLVVTGNINPFKEKPAMQLKLKLKNYPLTSLSAYTVQAVGTALASGQLKLKTKISVADDELDMENTVMLKKLETETISAELAAELDNELPIPLDAALSILRDNNRDITLDIPLSGTLSELDVGISDVLITGLSKAIIPAATGYLVYALGPYAALTYVGMKVGEKLLQIDLPPVVFMQQETAITEEHAKYLERIAKILIDRPDPDLQICPRVASWEFLTKEEKTAIIGDTIEVDEKNRERLLDLGQQRATSVQNHLSNNYGIDLNRLLICDTRIEKEKITVPLVLLQL